MKKVSVLAAVALIMPGAASALGVGYNFWEMEPEGTVSDGGREIDLQSELGFSSTDAGSWLIEGEGLTLEFTPMDFQAQGTLESSANFGGGSFSADVDTNAKIDDISVTRFWYPWEYFGVGGVVKILDGEFRVQETGGSESGEKTVSEIFPMLAIKLQYPVMSFLELSTKLAAIKAGDNSVVEGAVDLYLGGETKGISLGWRMKDYDLNDGGFSLDARVDGLYAQGIVRF